MLKSFFLGLVLIVGFVLAMASLQMMIAGVWARQADLFLTDWYQRSGEPDDRVWQIAFHAAHQARLFSPAEDARHYERLGHIWQWRYFAKPYADPVATASRRAAANSYQIAIDLRPTWPYIWLNLAYTRLGLALTDNTFNQALNKAFLLGQWRIDIIRHVADIGLAAWDDLASETKLTVLSAINRTVTHSQHEAKWLEKRAKGHGQHAFFCLLIEPDIKQKYALCLR